SPPLSRGRSARALCARAGRGGHGPQNRTNTPLPIPPPRGGREAIAGRSPRTRFVPPGDSENARPSAASLPGLFVAGQAVLGSFPGREKIEIPELLREPHRIVDHPFELVVPAHLDKARQRKILAQRMSFEAVVGEQAPQIRMSREQHAIEIVSFAFE